MTQYRANGFRGTVEAEDFREAAAIFAGRMARKDYGRRGYCHHTRLDSWAEDGFSATVQTFIGRDVKNSGCEGRNVWIYLRKA